MTDGMSELLDNLRRQGRVDSSGQFRLNLEKALGRMERFALAEPRHGLRQIVSAAVAGGASRIEVSATRQTCCLEIEGWGFSFEALQELFPSLFASQRESARASMRELAVALYGVRGLGITGVELVSWGPQGGGRLELDRSCLSLAPLSRSPFPEGITRTRIRLGPRGALEQVRGLLNARLNFAARHLWHAIRLAPIPVFINGRQFSGPLEVGHCVGLLGFDPSFRWMGTTDLSLDLEPADGLDGYIAFEPETQGPELHVLLHGVLYEVHVELGPPRLQAFFRVDHLDRDLSLSRLVHGELLEQLLARVRRAVRRGICEMAGAVETAEQARAAFLLLDRMGPRSEDASWLFRRLKSGLLFRRASGRRVSVGEVMEEYRSRGYLVVEAPDATVKTRDLVVSEPQAQALLKLLFPSLIPASCHIEVGGTAVLAAAPLGTSQGMVCLDPLAPESCYRLRIFDLEGNVQEASYEDDLFPVGVDVRYRARWVSAVGNEEAVEAGRKALAELYRRLVADLPREPRRRRRANLCLLAYLAYLCRPPTTFSRLLEEGAPGLSSADLAGMAAAVALPLASGGAVSLQSLLEEPGMVYYSLKREPMAPTEGLLKLTDQEVGLLGRLLAPGRLAHLSESYFD